MTPSTKVLVRKSPFDIFIRSLPFLSELRSHGRIQMGQHEAGSCNRLRWYRTDRDRDAITNTDSSDTTETVVPQGLNFRSYTRIIIMSLSEQLPTLSEVFLTDHKYRFFHFLQSYAEIDNFPMHYFILSNKLPVLYSLRILHLRPWQVFLFLPVRLNKDVDYTRYS